MYRMLSGMLVFAGILAGAPGPADAEVSCSNEKGECLIDATGQYQCSCADGVDHMGSYDSDGDLEGEEKSVATEALCREALTQNCLNDPLDPETICDSESKVLCEDMYAEWGQCVSAYDGIDDISLAKCCNDYEIWAPQMRWLLDCMSGKSCDERDGPCYEVSPCSCDGDPTDEPREPRPPGPRAIYRDTDIDVSGFLDDGSGCASTGSAYAGILPAALIGLAVRRRRRQ